MHDLEVDQHIDRDGRVVPGDAGLRRHVEHVLAQIDDFDDVDDREQGKDESRAFLAIAYQPAEAEVNEALILWHNTKEERHDYLLAN